MTFGIAVFAIAFALWRHRSHTDQRLRLYEMMHLRGVQSLRSRDPAAARDAVAAEHRCVACASKQMCDELLRTGDSEGYRRFCPNALYLEWLRSNSLRFD